VHYDSTSGKITFRILRRAKDFLKSIRAGVFAVWNWLRHLQTPGKLKRYNKLHLGCGKRHIDGWANVDIAGVGNIIWDLRRKLPVAEHSIQYIYAEHFIEHITKDEATALLASCKLFLSEGGILRLSTPDLRLLVKNYMVGNVVDLRAHAGWMASSPCAMVNESMRWWGHQFLYDEEELTALLKAVGFGSVHRVQWGVSENLSLQNLETRPDFGEIILEAQ